MLFRLPLILDYSNWIALTSPRPKFLKFHSHLVFLGNGKTQTNFWLQTKPFRSRDPPQAMRLGYVKGKGLQLHRILPSVRSHKLLSRRACRIAKNEVYSAARNRSPPEFSVAPTSREKNSHIIYSHQNNDEWINEDVSS